jgi:hypothetical protein
VQLSYNHLYNDYREEIPLVISTLGKKLYTVGSGDDLSQWKVKNINASLVKPKKYDEFKVCTLLSRVISRR